MNEQSLVDFLAFSNEILSIGIVIIAVSMLLYNITRNSRDPVTRASSVLLASVSISYVADTFVALDPSPEALENWFRFQWIGVALVPAALFHLSDALLATTGLISRGRRRRAVRLLYLVGVALAVLAMATDWLVRDLVTEPVEHMNAAPAFALYLLYFLVGAGVALVNVVRAWNRCLTTYTRRRMSYLLAAFLTPAWGVFPYSLLMSALSSGLSAFPEVILWLVFNIANLGVMAMLAFMAYPLSFFGTYKPDREVKAELLQFMLRGPLTGVVIVAVIQSFPHVTNVLGVEGHEFITFAAVAAVLTMQWSITLIMPTLENRLIYTQDQQQARLFQEFSQRLFTRSDASQLQEAILAAVCDQLRVPTAFLASLRPDGFHLEQYIGDISTDELEAAQAELAQGLNGSLKRHNGFFLWRSYWLMPLREDELTPVIGLIGIWARTPEPDLTPEEDRILKALAARATGVLSDLRMQAQIYTTIEELIPGSQPQPIYTANVSPFGQVSMQNGDTAQTQGQIVVSPEFTDMVRNALRYYWGGAKLAESELLNLNVVDNEATKSDGNRVNALRRVLSNAIERLRPEGQQNFTRTDWILYNILEMRFLQGLKVRDVARRLTMSQSDFYRKQRAAIEEVARIVVELEQQHLSEASGEDTVSN